MNRRAWLAVVRSSEFPRELRTIRFTLTELPMTSAGVLAATMDKIAVRTGLPVRTVERHIAKAVEAGYLDHVVRGGHGRTAQYTASIPELVVRHSWRTKDGSCPPSSTDNSAGVVRHLVADSYIETERSEGVALDSTAPPDSSTDQERIDGSGSTSFEVPELSAVLAAKITGCADCDRRGYLDQPACPAHRFLPITA